MSMFDLYPDDQRKVAQLARRNSIDATKPLPPLGFAGTGEAAKALALTGAHIDRAILGAGLAGTATYDTVHGWISGDVEHGATDWWAKHVVQDFGKDIVASWTPDASKMGSAARTLAPIFGVAGAIPFMAATPELFLGSAALSPALRLTDEGASTTTALAGGAISLGVNAAGFALPPMLGKTLTTRVGSAMGINVGLGAAHDAAMHAILMAGGKSDLAKNYQWANLKARGMDVLMGVAFGGIAHAGEMSKTRSLADMQRQVNAHRGAVKDALMVQLSGDHFTASSVPGIPTSLAAVGRGKKALTQAIDDILHGEPVNVTDMIRPDDFIRTPEPENFTAYRRALESGGNPNARNPNSSATGIDQFTKHTWLATVKQAAPEWADGLTNKQLLAERLDPVKSGEMADYLTAQNARALQAAGVPVINESLYAAWHFGPEKAIAFAKAKPGTKMADILTRAQMQANPYLWGMTKAEALANWDGRAGVPEGMQRYPGEKPVAMDAPNFGMHEKHVLPPDDALLKSHAKDESPERVALRETLVEERFAGKESVPEGEKPIAVVMGGGGGAGKGSVQKMLRKEGIVTDDMVHLDPDDFKTGDTDTGVHGLPEYAAITETGDSGAANATHEESDRLYHEALNRGIEGNYNLLLDRTLSNPVKAAKELQRLKDAGYHVIHIGVTIPTHEAMARASERHLTKPNSRFVPPPALIKAHVNYSNGFEQFAHIPDETRLYDNFVPRDEGALMIHHRRGREVLQQDDVLYNDFRRKGHGNKSATTFQELHASQAAGASSQAGRVGRKVPPDAPAATGRAGGTGSRTGTAAEPAENAVTHIEPPAEATAILNQSGFEAQGFTTTVTTERGMTIPVRWALADVDTLVTSHDDALSVNPAFPAELQPRDRSRSASEQQITRIANDIKPEFLAESPKAADGAPIVGVDHVVESGNARTIALRRAYDAGGADGYREFLRENLERFGIDPGALDQFTEPMLVRVTLGEYDRTDFTRQANESTVAGMSATEQAFADAQRMPDLGELKTNTDGTINTRASGDFARAFLEQAVGPNDRGALTTASGELSQAGQARIRNAVFARAYGDPDLVAMLTESTDANVKNILSGMMRSSAAVARVREMIAEGGRYGPDIAPDLTAAVRKFSQLRSEGMTVEAYFQQADMFGQGGLTTAGNDLLRSIAANANAPKRMAEFLQKYVDAVDAMGDPNQLDMLAGVEGNAVQQAASAMPDEEPAPMRPGAGLFGAGGRPTREAETDVVTSARAVAAINPDMAITLDDGTVVTAAEALAQADHELKQTVYDARGIEAAANCAMRYNDAI